MRDIQVTSTNTSICGSRRYELNSRQPRAMDMAWWPTPVGYPCSQVSLRDERHMKKFLRLVKWILRNRSIKIDIPNILKCDTIRRILTNVSELRELPRFRLNRLTRNFELNRFWFSEFSIAMQLQIWIRLNAV